MTEATFRRPVQTAVGVGVALVGLGLAGGALTIPGEAGYGGVGPNFLPWVVAIVLLLCGAMIVRESLLAGGFRELDEPTGSAHAWWPGLAWISAALLLNAALITTIGFILSCTLCYVLAVQGLRRAQDQGQAGSTKVVAIDVFTGALISAPVFWMFTKFLAINLPGLTGTGWI